MRYLRLIAVTAAGCAFAAGSLRAQLPTGTGLMDFGTVGHGPYRFAVTSTGGGAFTAVTDPYSARFQVVRTPLQGDPLPLNVVTSLTSTGFGPAYDVFCVSLLNGISQGMSNIPSYFTNLGSNAAAIGLYTRPHTLNQYLEAAWLATQIVSFSGATAYRDRAEYSGAIWQAMDGAGNIGYFYDPITLSWVDLAPVVALANAAVLGGWGVANEESWVVVTPTDACGAAVGLDPGHCALVGGTQEMLVHVDVTPEPATMLLLGTGLMVMMLGAGAVRRLSA